MSSVRPSDPFAWTAFPPTLGRILVPTSPRVIHTSGGPAEYSLPDAIRIHYTRIQCRNLSCSGYSIMKNTSKYSKDTCMYATKLTLFTNTIQRHSQHSCLHSVRHSLRQGGGPDANKGRGDTPHRTRTWVRPETTREPVNQPGPADHTRPRNNPVRTVHYSSRNLHYIPGIPGWYHQV